MDAYLQELSSVTKEKLQTILIEMKEEIGHLLDELENNRCCILSDFTRISELFMKIQKVASSYYFETYLAPYSCRYPALAIAAQRLSKKRHGALIVVEREVPVTTWIQEGVPIHAQLSAPLLESIFYPGNPLHDGAVVVKEDFILSAANVLPLSKQTTGHKMKIGTRHRAALGLTEKTDAFVLVVSEETGRISFALDGKLYPLTHEGMQNQMGH
ncbi:MAG: sporulation-specific diadenylate cyclase CdaS [Thermoactinomyces sp.]